MEQAISMWNRSAETEESPFADGIEYVQGWLRWLDAGIELRLCTEESDRAGLAERWENARRRSELRTRLSEQESVFLPLPYLARLFELTAMEEKMILICLAIEVDRKYEAAFELL